MKEERKISRIQKRFLFPHILQSLSISERVKRTLRSLNLNFKEKIEAYKKLPYRDREKLEKRVTLSIFLTLLAIFILPKIPAILLAIVSILLIIFKAVLKAALEWEFLIDLDAITLFGKAAWDWFELLIIPILLGSSGVLYRQILAKQEIHRTRHELLKTYFNQMTELMLNPAWPLISKESSVKESIIVESEEVKRIASIVRALTFTTLRELDSNGRHLLLKFFIESGSLQFVPMTSLNLSGMDLFRANLSGASLEKVTFADANLVQANMKRISAQDADLLRTILDKADLSGANLAHADLQGTELVGANLTGANLFEAHLEGVILVDADLTGADLTGATFYNVNLENANFHQALLKDVTWDKASFCEGLSVGLETAVDVPEELKQHLGLVCGQPDKDRKSLYGLGDGEDI